MHIHFVAVVDAETFVFVPVFFSFAVAFLTGLRHSVDLIGGVVSQSCGEDFFACMVALCMTLSGVWLTTAHRGKHTVYSFVGCCLATK